jgi:hypothetical protein
MEKGDYVVATKYSDGDPRDHFVVGFFRDMTWHRRYNIIDDNGKLFRSNGFRKAKKISKRVGIKLMDEMKTIESSNNSVWTFVAHFEVEPTNDRK